MKNTIKSHNYYLPGELEREIEAFVGHYNNKRVHEDCMFQSEGLAVFLGNIAPCREGL